MTDTSTSRGRLYQDVARRITKLIDEGTYPPGTRLPGERALAEQLEVSRVTIREALISLQTLGLVEIRTGSGAYVVHDPKADTAMIGGLIEGITEGMGTGADLLPEASAFELTQARLLFESEAAALAAPDISDETLEHLEALIETMESNNSQEEADLADREFHLTIAEASENRVVAHVVRQLWRIRMENEPIRKVYHAVCSMDIPKRGDEHAEVLEALRAHDPEAARLAMRRHFRRLIESMLEVTEEQALEKVREQAAKTRRKYLKGAA